MFDLANSVEKIDMDIPARFFPDCRYPLFESLARRAHGISNFDLAYPWHSFWYTKEADEIALKPNTGLNISLNRYMPDLISYEDGYDCGPIARRIRDLYGVVLKKRPFDSFHDFLDHVFTSLQLGDPIFCTYSLGHVPTRRHYQKSFGYHSICIIGYDSEKKVMIGLEQSQSPIFEVTYSDLKDCFKYIKDLYGEFLVFDIERVDGCLTRASSALDIISICDNNIENLNSDGDSKGINGLINFSKDIQRYVMDNPSLPIFVPNIWVFSYERITSCSWLHFVKAEYPQTSLHIDDMINHFSLLHDKWLSIDFICEMAFNASTGKFNKSVIKQIIEVVELEKLSASKWMTLKKFFK